MVVQLNCLYIVTKRANTQKVQAVLITHTDLSRYLTGPGHVSYFTDGYGRVWARVDGDLTLDLSTDEPLPYMVEVHGSLVFKSGIKQAVNAKAKTIDLTEATVEVITRSEFTARNEITISKAGYPHLSKRTRRCNSIAIA